MTADTPSRSGNTGEPFTEPTTKGLYQTGKALNNELDDRDPCDAEEFLEVYRREKRAEANRDVWTRDLPTWQWTEERGVVAYRTVAEAYEKLVRDAHFYTRDWETVKQVLRRSPYLTTF